LSVLIFASFTYIVFFVDTKLPESIMLGIMSIMAIAELSLSVWLIVSRRDSQRESMKSKRHTTIYKRH